MERVRIGIVGCGGIANGKHLPALKQLSDRVELVAFCDLIEERAARAKAGYGTPDAKVTVDYHELLEDKTIDCIYVLTPNNMHSVISIDAMESGKHVMCEKPMAKTYAEAKAMLECSRRTGRLLNIGYQNRYRDELLYLKQMTEAGELGEVYYAKAHAIRRRAVPTWGIFLDAEAQGGGPLIDIGTHALDMTLWCMDNYKPRMAVGSVYRKLADQTEQGNAWGNWDPKKYTVEDSAFGTVIMENGATVVVESSWALNTVNVLEANTSLCGTLAGADTYMGKLRVNGVKNNKQYVFQPNFAASGAAFFAGETNDPNVKEQLTFLDAVTKGTPLTVLPEQAVVVSQILEAIYISGRTGKPYYFGEENK
ncbi:MAG: Gfo/Idh/MocA family oxidoreductase [Eubacteriales bacterium]|nr:Gfo/Idh/MocA family oxidoreductase [Eubacteriales bacterium]